MKAYLFISPQKQQYAMYHSYIGVLGKMCDITNTLADSDIVFIIGAWSAKGAHLAKLSCKMGIPYIVCPLGDHSERTLKTSWLKRTIQSIAYERRMYRKASLVLATTPMEKNYLMKQRWNKKVVLLRYFNYTHAITKSEMTETLQKTGAIILSGFEQQKAEAIASQTKDAIAIQIIQIRSRMPHKNIPQNYLEELHALLYADNYDEDALNTELASLKISSFAASVFQAMTEKTGLTEGFMPLPPKKGKTSKQILKYVSTSTYKHK